LAHAQRLSGRLRRAGLRGRTITLKVRYPDFSTITRSQTTTMAVDGSRQLFLIATELLSGLGGPAEPVRLLGLGASALEPADQPKQLDIDDNAGWDSVETAIAGVRERFGEAALGPARLIGSKKSKRPDPEP